MRFAVCEIDDGEPRDVSIVEAENFDAAIAAYVRKQYDGERKFHCRAWVLDGDGVDYDAVKTVGVGVAPAAFRHDQPRNAPRG